MIGFYERNFALEMGPKDKRDYKINMYGLSPENAPDEYVHPFHPPVQDQGRTSMCLDFTYKAVEESQYMYQNDGEYREFATGYSYGQKIFAEREGMVEIFEVANYTKRGLPFAESFNVVGTAAECKEYFDKNITDEIVAEALSHRNRSYITADTPDELVMGILNFNSYGYIGVEIFDCWRNVEEDGIIPPVSGRSLGHHAMACAGRVVVDGVRYLTGPNTWGEAWGKDGWYLIPEDSPMIKKMRVFADATPALEIINLSIGDPEINLLRENFVMDIAPFIKDGRTLISLRFITEVLGYNVQWYPGRGTMKQGLVKVWKDIEDGN